jgi:hypothetical protein
MSPDIRREAAAGEHVNDQIRQRLIGHDGEVALPQVVVEMERSPNPACAEARSTSSKARQRPTRPDSRRETSAIRPGTGDRSARASGRV